MAAFYELCPTASGVFFSENRFQAVTGGDLPAQGFSLTPVALVCLD